MENIFSPKWTYIKPCHYLEYWQVEFGTYSNHASATAGKFNGVAQAMLTLTFLDKEEVEFKFTAKTIKEAKSLVVDKIKEIWEI